MADRSSDTVVGDYSPKCPGPRAAPRRPAGLPLGTAIALLSGMTNTSALALAFSFAASHGTVQASFPCGSLVLYRGKFVTVLETDLESYAQPMIRVTFDGVRTGWLKFSEIGTKS